MIQHLNWKLSTSLKVLVLLRSSQNCCFNLVYFGFSYSPDIFNFQKSDCLLNRIPTERRRAVESVFPDKSDRTAQKKKYFDVNSEILNMSNIPNKRNSQLLCDLIAEEFFVDPFRHFFPNRREFSYVPFNKKNDNRSRIDFFLTSRDILTITEEITYTPLLTSLFDHKAVKLKIGVFFQECLRRPQSAL